MSSVPQPIGCRIAGTGMCLPMRLVTNDDLAQTVETDDAWISQRTGIRQRYLCQNDETIVTLSTQAVQQALKNSDLDASDLDLLICATMTPEMVCPATACQIIDQLDATQCGGFDLSAACSGFVVGLNIASSLIATGMYRNIAVVGAEQLSKLVNWDDRRTCVLFGDGAAAAIVQASDNPNQRCLYQSITSDGSRGSDLYCPRDEKHIEPGASFNGTLDTLQMNGQQVYKFAVSQLHQMLNEALAATGLSIDQIKLIIPHQSNQRILESVQKRMGLPKDQLYINIDRYGNTSAASVAVCLHEVMEQQRLSTGDHVIFAALGGGLTWTVSVWQM